MTVDGFAIRQAGPANVEPVNLRRLISEGRARRVLHVRLQPTYARAATACARTLGLPGQVAMEQQMARGGPSTLRCVRDFNVKGEIIQRRVCGRDRFDSMEALP